MTACAAGSHDPWVVQEVVNFREIAVHCGGESISCLSMLHLSKLSNQCGQSFELEDLFTKPEHVAWLEHLGSMRLWRQSSVFSSESAGAKMLLKNLEITNHASKWYAMLAYVCDWLGRCVCQDPRDKIYAALAIANKCSDHKVNGGLIPDYRVSITELYTNMAWNRMVHTRSLYYLECQRTSRRSPNLGLLTWVPDFASDEFQHEPEPIVNTLAHDGTARKVSYARDQEAS